MRREDIPHLLNKYGPYQRRLFLLMLFPLMMEGYLTLMVVVVFYTPAHRCRLPNLPNDTFAIQSEEHLMMVNSSSPLEESSGGVQRFSQCLLYAHRNNGTTLNATGSDVTEPCDAWVYDDSEFDNTIATQFDMVCQRRGFRANFNMVYMIGTLTASFVCGILCDRFGKKPVLVTTFAVAVVVNIAMAFPVLPEVLFVYRFIQAFTGRCLYTAMYVLGLELMGPSLRNLAGYMAIMMWLSGCFLLSFVSYGVKDWRYIAILSGGPFALCLINFCFIPESPLWLYSKGRVKDATAVVMQVVRYNKLALPEDIDMAEFHPTNGEGSSDKDQKKRNPLLPGAEEKSQEQASQEKEQEEARQQKGQDLTLQGKDQQAVLLENEGRGVEAGEEEETKQDEPSVRRSLAMILTDPTFLVRTAIIWFNWAMLAMSYYGITLNVSNLPGGVRPNLLISCVVEVVGYTSAWLLLDKVGRKRLHCFVMLLSGIACLATIFPVAYGGPDVQWVTTALAMVGKLGLSAAYSSIYLMTAEQLPTVIRNTGLGCAIMMSKVGSTVSPYVADMGVYFGGRLAQALPLIVFGSLTLTAGLLALVLPETVNRKLPDTIEEAVNFNRMNRNLSTTNGKKDDQNEKIC